MHVLVTVASKHGATAEIGAAIAEQLRTTGLTVSVLRPGEVKDLDPYEAVVIGSAVYTGYWLKPATAMIARFKTSFPDKKVWLFSSGPIGDPLEPPGDPFSIESAMETTGAVEHVVFPGALDRENLGFGEKAIVVALRVPDGDFRPWDEIRAWANSIAAELKTVRA